MLQCRTEVNMNHPSPASITEKTKCTERDLRDNQHLQSAVHEEAEQTDTDHGGPARTSLPPPPTECLPGFHLQTGGDTSESLLRDDDEL